MHEEQLFEMLNEAIAFAKLKLETEQVLAPFAMVLYEDGNVESINAPEARHEEQYEMLLGKLKEKVEKEPAITAISVIARVNIPAQYKAAVNDGIRIHLEERHKSDNKIGARFLYVPYQLYKHAESGEVTMELHNPIPVAFPPEIFTS